MIAKRDQTEPKLVSIESNDALDEQDERVLPTASIISQLIDSISSGEKVECDLQAGRRVQALLEAALISDRRRCWLSVDSKDKVIEAV